MQLPTLTNVHIRSVRDAECIFYAVARGLLPMTMRRLDAEERRAIVSGNVYVWEERVANSEATGLGIERWTDGMRWSASRVRDDFLFYHQKDTEADEAAAQPTRWARIVRVEPGVDGQKSRMNLSSTRSTFNSHDPTSPNTASSLSQRERDRVPQSRPSNDPEKLVKQAYSVIVSIPQDCHRGAKKWHLTAYFTQASLDTLGTIDTCPGVRQNVPDGWFKCARTGKAKREAKQRVIGNADGSSDAQPTTGYVSSSPPQTQLGYAPYPVPMPSPHPGPANVKPDESIQIQPGGPSSSSWRGVYQMNPQLSPPGYYQHISPRPAYSSYTSPVCEASSSKYASVPTGGVPEALPPLTTLSPPTSQPPPPNVNVNVPSTLTGYDYARKRPRVSLPRSGGTSSSTSSPVHSPLSQESVLVGGRGGANGDPAVPGPHAIPWSTSSRGSSASPAPGHRDMVPFTDLQSAVWPRRNPDDDILLRKLGNAWVGEGPPTRRQREIASFEDQNKEHEMEW